MAAIDEALEQLRFEVCQIDPQDRHVYHLSADHFGLFRDALHEMAERERRDARVRELLQKLRYYNFNLLHEDEVELDALIWELKR